MSNWVNNICDVLDKCDIPQLRSTLIGTFHDKDGKLTIGKCAMGVLSCEAGMTLTPDMNDDLISDDENYEEILKLYDVPEEFWHDIKLPAIRTHRDDELIQTEFATSSFPIYGGIIGTVSFHEFIFGLNDGGLTFKEIAECIRITFGDAND